MTTVEGLPQLTCRICGKEIARDDGYIPEGDLHSYSHTPCYVSEYRHANGLPCGDPLCAACGDPRDSNLDVVRLGLAVR